MSDINLLDSFREERKQKRKAALWIIPVVVVWIVMFFIYVIANQSIDQMRSKMALISIDQGKLEEAQHLESQVEELEKWNHVLKTIAMSNRSIDQMALFNYFNKTLPKDKELYIYKYTLDNEGVCTIYGYTKYEKYLGELIHNLDNSKLFKNIQINYTKSEYANKRQSEIEAFSFQLTLDIEGE